MTPFAPRVLIVDDSASVRQTLSAILSGDAEIEVIGTASDAHAAARRLQSELLDVMILDIEMPGMDGLTFLKKIMAQHPIPVIVCSILTDHGSKALFEALESGAVEIMPKPKVDTRAALTQSTDRIRQKVKAAAQAKVRKRDCRPMKVERKLTADVILPPLVPGRVKAATEHIVCNGASTGGAETLREILTPLPEKSPGIVIVQHMPEKFTAAFARRLDGLCAIEVKEAVQGDEVRVGRAQIAPGNFHLVLRRVGAE